MEKNKMVYSKSLNPQHADGRFELTVEFSDISSSCKTEVIKILDDTYSDLKLSVEGGIILENNKQLELKKLAHRVKGLEEENSKKFNWLAQGKEFDKKQVMHLDSKVNGIEQKVKALKSLAIFNSIAFIIACISWLCSIL